MKPTLEQVIAYAQSDLDAAPPSPYEIALCFSAALLQSGRFADDSGAAIETAWTLVPTYYQGRAAYENVMRTMGEIAASARAGGVSFVAGSRVSQADTAGMSPAEAAAYVAGETGDMGEMRAGKMPTVRVDAHGDVDLRKIQERQRRIAETTTAVLEAEQAMRAAVSAVHDAKNRGQSPKLIKRLEAVAEQAQAAFDEAARAQSEAYE